MTGFDSLDSRIDKIVANWEIDEDDTNDKKRILNKWQSEVRPAYYEKLLSICEHFTYYSMNKTSATYKSTFHNELAKHLENDSGLLFQLTTKDTIESSHTMYSVFISSTNLSRTHSDYCYPSFPHFINIIKNIDDRIKNERETMEFENREKKRLNIIKDIDTLVFIDDFIGTGANVIQSIKQNIEDFKLLKRFMPKVKNAEINLVIVVLEATEVGINNIKENVKQYTDVINLKIVKGTLAESIFKSNYIFEEDQDALDTLEEEFKEIAEEKDLGWGKYTTLKKGYNLNLNIASYENTPNNTFPLISQPKEPTGKWEGLFPRKSRKRVQYSNKNKDLSTYLHDLKSE